jgi:hypothetical protein
LIEYPILKCAPGVGTCRLPGILVKFGLHAEKRSKFGGGFPPIRATDCIVDSVSYRACTDFTPCRWSVWKTMENRSAKVL